MTDPHSPPPPYPYGGTQLPQPLPYGPPPPRPTNTFAVLAIVFGVLGGILAIPFGHIARSQIRRTGEEGSGLALAGLILGYIWLAASLVALIFFVVFVAWIGAVANEASSEYDDYTYSAPTSRSYASASPTTRAVPTTRSVPTTVPRTSTRLTPTVAGTDSQGFVTGPRCNSTNPAVAIGRTTKSQIVVCQTGTGRYYYKGLRISDGAAIELDDPTPSGSGFVVFNGAARYTFDASSLVITEGSNVLANEPMLAYWSN